MRNTDPLDFFAKHRETIFRWGGIAAAVLVLFLILRFFAMRMGGWKAAGRRLWREIALTVHAFGGPVRAWLRYRRSVRLLVRGLGASTTWRDAERALVAAKFAAAPAQPYAAVVGDDTVTVLFAAAEMVPPRGPWRPVADDPWAWAAVRAELPSVTPDAEGIRPVVVALGERERECVFLDLVVGPALVCVQGDPRSGPVLFQAVAAQVDARLPAGQVVVADGVHRDLAGAPVRDAYRAARAIVPRLGLPTFLVTPELPDPLPPELTEPPADAPSLRLLLGGPGRGHIRTLLTDAHGQVGIPGTPLVAACNALGAALARVLPTIPPVLPPVPAPVTRPGVHRTEWFAEEEVEVAQADASVAERRVAEPVVISEPAEIPASAVSARSAVAVEPSPARSPREAATSAAVRASTSATPAGSPGVSARHEAASRRDPAADPARSSGVEPPAGRDPAALVEPTHRPDSSPPAEPDPPRPDTGTGTDNRTGADTEADTGAGSDLAPGAGDPPRPGPEPSSPGPRA